MRFKEGDYLVSKDAVDKFHMPLGESLRKFERYSGLDLETGENYITIHSIYSGREMYGMPETIYRKATQEEIELAFLQILKES